MLHQVPEHFICSTSCSFNAEVSGLVSVTITCLLIVAVSALSSPDSRLQSWLHTSGWTPSTLTLRHVRQSWQVESLLVTVNDSPHVEVSCICALMHPELHLLVTKLLELGLILSHYSLLIKDTSAPVSTFAHTLCPDGSVIRIDVSTSFFLSVPTLNAALERISFIKQIKERLLP
ncbi:hypothetical protein Pelo_7131 [Pelomyxa schiedti]|nr:hypothetical protein Pelo_7131 [Pelomyxa schiedti]